MMKHELILMLDPMRDTPDAPAFVQVGDIKFKLGEVLPAKEYELQEHWYEEVEDT